MMYVFEYLVYHLKPYGYNTILKVSCDENGQAEGKGDKSTKENTGDGQAEPIVEQNEEETNDRRRRKLDKSKAFVITDDNEGRHISTEKNSTAISTTKSTTLGNRSKNNIVEITKTSSKENLLNKEKPKETLLKKTLSGSSSSRKR